jgi:hypothetical protein
VRSGSLRTGKVITHPEGSVEYYSALLAQALNLGMGHGAIDQQCYIRSVLPIILPLRSKIQ